MDGRVPVEAAVEDGVVIFRNLTKNEQNQAYFQIFNLHKTHFLFTKLSQWLEKLDRFVIFRISKGSSLLNYEIIC